MQFTQQQQAGIDGISVPCGGEGIQFGVKCIGDDFFTNAFGIRAPQVFLRFELQFLCDGRQPVAGRPAHDAGKRMDLFFFIPVPYIGVRLVEAGDGFFAEPFEIGKDIPVGRAVQALVEESLCAGENGRAVDVVLCFPVGTVADPYRPHVVVPGQIGRDFFFQIGVAMDAVYRLERKSFGIGNDVQNVLQITLHCPGCTQPVQGTHDEVGIAYPAVAVIAIVFRGRGAGNGGRDGGDDRTGIVKGVHAQGDGRADDHVLPFERHRHVMNPVLPVFDCRFIVCASDVLWRGFHGLIRAENQGDRLFQKEGFFVQYGADGRVGRDPQGLFRPLIRNMVRARQDLGRFAAVVHAGPDADGDAGTACNAPDDPDNR